MTSLGVTLIGVASAAVFTIGTTWMGWVSLTLVKILQGITRNDAHNSVQDKRLDELEQRIDEWAGL